MKIREPIFIALRKEIDHLEELTNRERNLTQTTFGDDVVRHIKKEMRFRADRQYLIEFLELISDKVAAGDEL